MLREPAFRSLTLAGAREDQLVTVAVRPWKDGYRCSVVVGREVALLVGGHFRGPRIDRQRPLLAVAEILVVREDRESP